MKYGKFKKEKGWNAKIKPGLPTCHPRRS